MKRNKGYFLGLLATSILGSVLNVSGWYIEHLFDRDEGYSFGGEFYFLIFLVMVFFSFLALTPVFGIMLLFEQKLHLKSVWWLYVLLYLIYYLVMFYYFRFRDKDNFIGYHIYVLSWLFSSYLIIWRTRQVKETDLLDN